MRQTPSHFLARLELFFWLTFLAFPVGTAYGQGATPATVWLEGEAPAMVVPADLKPEIAGWGHPEYLSGQKWLQISIDAGKVDAQVPDSGIVLTYRFSSPQTAVYDIWNRIGYEEVRSPFEWRVDDSAWATVEPTDRTTDLEELQQWNPIAWLKMGRLSLSAGPHTLEIRLHRTKDDKGKTARVLYASDALCLSAVPFHPDGPHPPGDPSAQTDADRAAASHVFTATAPADAAQTMFGLGGVWQYARDDEDVVTDPDKPIPALPDAENLHWKAFTVPGDRDKELPEDQYGHRYWLRTRVLIPAQAAGRSFYLHFPGLNMLATVFVNGRRCGGCDTPFAAWDCDITRAIFPGQANDIWVGIKDTYYALPLAAGPGAQYIPYLPADLVAAYGPASFSFPVWNHAENGLLREPTLVTAGRAYTSDVFAMPSVKNKSLGLQVTITDSAAQPLTVSVANDVVPLAGGLSVKTFAAQDIVVPAGQATVLSVSVPWSDPKLWWPDDPQQYQVVTRLSIGGKVIDERRTKFGFREWGWTETQLTLNGVPWHGRADTFDPGDPDKALALWRRHGQNMIRDWGEDGWDGLNNEDALDWFDANGLVVRRTGIFDGEAVKYNLTDGNGHIRQDLFDHWRDQLAAWVKGQRNHPSIAIWSIENEIAFINAHVFGQDAVVDPAEAHVAQTVAALDPTRPVMTDGGNALLDQSMPVYGAHYLEAPLTDLPDGAYRLGDMTHRQVWPVTQPKPLFLGETFYANGIDPADLATVGGESAFVGKAEAYPAVGLAAKMYSEGYRWAGVAAFHLWEGGVSDVYYNSWQPVAVLCRQWDWSFGAGRRVPRTLGIFNDTHTTLPISLTWTLTVGGRQVAQQTSLHTVAAGGSEKFPMTLPMPQVGTRQEGEWTLALSVHGKPVFRDMKPVSVLPPPSLSVTSPLAVYDPSGTTAAFLRRQHVSFTPLHSLDALPAAAKTLIVGQDALTPAQSGSSALAAYAASGRAVIVLEQKNPLHYQGLPAAMDTETNAGEIAFAEDLTHPILHGLQQKDFFTWGEDGLVYRNAYAKPSAGGKSLIECGSRLHNTACAELPVGKGVLIVSQLALGEKLADNPVAQTLLRNMVEYGSRYRRVVRPVTVAAGDNGPLLKALDAMGLQYAKTADPLAAIHAPDSIAVVTATPAALHALAAEKGKVAAFTQSGGWLVLNNLTPDGLTDYNALVGVDHLIRPFRREKVTFPPLRSPLTAGLPAQDIVMDSGQRIFPWAAGEYPATDAFSYVVDYYDVAPFAASSFFAYGNIVNNFVSADGWPLIINFPAPADGKPYDIPITLPRPETIIGFTWVGNTNYWPQTKVHLLFGADRRKTIAFDVAPTGDPQTFAVPDPQPAKDLTLEIAGWQEKPGVAANIGIDNITLKAKRSPVFYAKVKPMLNIGALVEYPNGAGGIVLCNVLYKDSETVPENAVKKQDILATILRNLDAAFSGGQAVIAGAGLQYAPLDLSRQANQYRTAQGWFGDKAFTFADLPTGTHTFAGVRYNIYDFATSPVPTVVMLGASGVPGALPDHVDGIPVGRKADALFFLQAARLDARRSAEEVRDKKAYEMADYVVHYADGQTVKIPVYAEISVDDYRQKAPAPLPGAQIAWTKPYAGTDFSAVAYSMQWNNPRPSVPIQSVDLVSGPDRRGPLALLALTAATAP